MTLKHWTSETGDDGIVWLCIDKADGGANVLSGDVLRELHQLIEHHPVEQPEIGHSGVHLDAAEVGKDSVKKPRCEFL